MTDPLLKIWELERRHKNFRRDLIRLEIGIEQLGEEIRKKKQKGRPE